MDAFRKIIYSFLIAISVLSICNCGTTLLVKKQDDSLVIAEIEPLPKTVQLKKKVQYEPVYGYMRILEISMENGVQTEVTAKIGSITKGLEKGTVGDISPTSDFSEIIGTFKIKSVVRGFVMCKVENLTRKIPANGYIRVQIGEKEIEE